MTSQENTPYLFTLTPSQMRLRFWMNIDKRFDIALGNVTTMLCGTLSKRFQHWTIFRLVSGISERLGTLSDKASGDKFIELMGCNHPWRVRLVASTQLAQSRRDGHELLSNLPPELVRDIRVKWLIEDIVVNEGTTSKYVLREK